ncbi:MAG: dTDP-4-dehydrorhamnose reductase [Bacteroidales bacterium]|nr:dTDP-4-dehydrorhamnose reductase [Bacteroidales bacterium]
MKILVTGADGQLGSSLKKAFSSHPEIEVDYTDADTLDITSREDVAAYLSKKSYDLLINCAAYTAVDKAESDALTATKINTEAVGILAAEAKKRHTRVMHFSTDYVFPGDHTCRPYNEHDEPDPHTIYGRTKLDGEAILKSFCPDAIIIRTAWLYCENGHNFVKTMLEKGRQNVPLRVVCDQIGTPTYAGDLATAVCEIISSGKWCPGIYHFTNEGVASWYDFAKAIFRIAEVPAEVAPCMSHEYASAARRPLYSLLDKTKIKKTYSLKIPYWEDSLQRCIEKIMRTENITTK